jgi:catechol 2,3-dioxygenase-like lactoylglutathione lyase family enzyme
MRCDKPKSDMRLTGVRIETRDLDADCARYAALLGVEPVRLATAARRFQLGRGAVELVEGETGRATVLFAPDGSDERWPTDPAAYHGLAIGIEASPEVASPARRADAAQAIDHVVVFTPNPARAIAFWRDALGLRLAFDREFAERKVRLMFFRSGGLTFEFACALPAPEDGSGSDRFYGISYRVPDLAARREALLAAGFDVSEIRPGNKTGTRVASVRSGTAGLPTLLLEEARTP